MAPLTEQAREARLGRRKRHVRLGKRQNDQPVLTLLNTGRPRPQGSQCPSTEAGLRKRLSPLGSCCAALALCVDPSCYYSNLCIKPSLGLKVDTSLACCQIVLDSSFINFKPHYCFAA